ncbi:MAG: DUF6794 domain-containing protein [Aureispira sp.]
MLRLLLFLSLLFFSFSLYAQREPNVRQAPTLPTEEVATNKVIIKTQKKRGDVVNDSIYQARVKQSKLDGMYIPRDIYDVFRELDKLMDDHAKETFMAFSDEEVDGRTHGTLGVWLENKWSLSEGSRLSEYFRKMNVPHYDYMIGLIIRSYHRHLHGRDLGLKEQVLAFRQLWNKRQQKKADQWLERGTVQDNGGEK